ncbi:hypothetical protein AaE_008611, partial [Aphanomyces astaci]
RGGFYTPATNRGTPAVAAFVSAAAPPTTEGDGASVPLPADNDPSDVRDDTDMGSDGGTAVLRRKFGTRRRSRSRRHFRARPSNERRAFMREYLKYLGQINALQCNGSRLFAMPVREGMDPFSKRRIALFDFNRDHHSITNDEWVAWFRSAFEEDPQDLDILKQRLQRAIRFDTKILDAESRVGRMQDELMRSFEQDHQEWVLHQEGKMVVEVMTKSIKSESLKTAVQKQLQLQRNKALKSDVFRYVNWLRTFAAGHQLYVGLDDESKPSPAAKPVEAPRGGKPQMPRRDSGREDAAKNNGRVVGKAETIVPNNAETSAKKGCLKCEDMSHRVARCPKTAPGEAETLLAAQPQRQKTERGVLLELLEYIARVDDVLLDSGSDVTVVTRGVMDALDSVKVGTVSHSVPHLAYPYGSDVKPVLMTRSIKFNCVTLDTTCGPLVLRGLKAWVDDAWTATELIVSRPVMELLGFSVEDLLFGARKKKEEWDVSSVPKNELSGMANVKRLMAEKLNPQELDPDDGMECATPE